VEATGLTQAADHEDPRDMPTNFASSVTYLSRKQTITKALETPHEALTSEAFPDSHKQTITKDLETQPPRSSSGRYIPHTSRRSRRP
jgi:hypothetical protein